MEENEDEGVETGRTRLIRGGEWRKERRGRERDPKLISLSLLRAKVHLM
jgi:hypothetical protein